MAARPFRYLHVPAYAEFIDEAHFVRPFAPKPVPVFGPHVVFLPREWVARTAQEQRLRDIAGTARLNEVIDNVEANGIRRALVIVVDDVGHVVLEDGHHRLVAAEIHGVDVLPVEIRRSERIRVSCGHLPDLLQSLLVSLRS